MFQKLTIPDKILVHLYSYRKYNDRYDYPEEMTQQGIAKSIGISVTHVPRNVKKLQEEGSIEIKKGHVHGKKKRVTIYLLTSQGILKAKKLIKEIEDYEIDIDGKYMRIEEIRKLTGMSLIEIVRTLEKGEKITIFKGDRVIFREVNIEYDNFVNRKNEIDTMKKWYTGGKILTIVGAKGIGKTTLVEEFLKRENVTMGIVFLYLYQGRTWESVKDVLEQLYGKREILEILRKSPTLLIFDNYYMVDDEFVEAMKSLNRENIGKSKIIVTMPSSTPYYNRFYSIQDISEGRIIEINLGPLKYKDAKKFLPEVREDAFKRIYQLTKGNTKLLSMLSKGSLENTINIPLTPETIHLLNYLASQKRKNT